MNKDDNMRMINQINNKITATIIKRLPELDLCYHQTRFYLNYPIPKTFKKAILKDPTKKLECVLLYRKFLDMWLDMYDTLLTDAKFPDIYADIKKIRQEYQIRYNSMQCYIACAITDCPNANHMSLGFDVARDKTGQYLLDVSLVTDVHSTCNCYQEYSNKCEIKDMQD